MIALGWRQVPPPIITRWRGPGNAAPASALVQPLPPLAAIIGPPGATISGTASLILPGGQGAFEAQATVAASGVTPASRIFLSFAPAAPSEENDPELLDMASLSGLAGNGSIAVTASFAAPVSGPVTIHWSAA